MLLFFNHRLITSSCVINFKLGKQNDTSVMSSYSSIMRGKSSSSEPVEEQEQEQDVKTQSPESVPDNTDTMLARDDEETQSLSVYGHAVGKTSSFLSWLLLIIWNKIVKRLLQNELYI